MKKLWLPLFTILAIGAAILLFHGHHGRAQTASVTLTWTATGDDGVVGTAASQSVRFALSRPDTTSQAAIDAWWATANSAPAMPVPRIAGSAESFTFASSFQTGSTYYFLLRVCDEVPNCTYSNVASKFFPDTLPPSKIFNLFVN